MLGDIELLDEAAELLCALVVDDGVEDTLDGLLDRVKDDEEARQEYLDLLELLGPDDPRTGDYRRKLSSRLF